MSGACRTSRRDWPPKRMLADTTPMPSSTHSRGSVGRLGRQAKPPDRVLPDVRFGHG